MTVNAMKRHSYALKSMRRLHNTLYTKCWLIGTSNKEDRDTLKNQSINLLLIYKSCAWTNLLYEHCLLTLYPTAASLASLVSPAAMVISVFVAALAADPDRCLAATWLACTPAHQPYGKPVSTVQMSVAASQVGTDVVAEHDVVNDGSWNVSLHSPLVQAVLTA